MLCKTAACLVAFSIILLLFTTSEAEIDIKKAKEAVNTMLTNLMRIVVEDNSQNIRDLVEIVSILVHDDQFEIYLWEIVNDEKYTWRMLEEINTYFNEFQELLNEAGIRKQQDLYTPMSSELRYFQKVLEHRLKIPPQMAQIPPSLRGVITTDSNKKDKNGFKIQQGIEEVIVMLDMFLKFFLDKQCIDLPGLESFANSMFRWKNRLHRNLLEAMPRHSAAIAGEIDAYQATFRQILHLPENSKDETDIPIIGILGYIRHDCTENLMPEPTAEASSSQAP